ASRTRSGTTSKAYSASWTIARSRSTSWPSCKNSRFVLITERSLFSTNAFRRHCGQGTRTHIDRHDVLHRCSSPHRHQHLVSQGGIDDPRKRGRERLRR